MFMINYGQYSRNVIPKIFMILLEIVILYISFLILFRGWGDIILSHIGFHPGSGNLTRKVLFLIFNVSLFIFYLPTLLIFVRRKVTWIEAINVAIAFSIYYLGFPLLGYSSSQKIDILDLGAIILFTSGITLHFICEYQRHIFKSKPENKDRLLTNGLWKFSRHFNYFSDLLWVSGYVVLTRNWWSITILIALFFFFYSFNIPIQEKYLASKYGKEYEEYRARTKSLIPFLL